jgi:uncharacterized membrane protein (DUF4010 family)
MISLLGGLTGILAQQVNAFLMGFVFLGLTSVLLPAYSKSVDKFEDFSITSIIASLITIVAPIVQTTSANVKNVF